MVGSPVSPTQALSLPARESTETLPPSQEASAKESVIPKPGPSQLMVPSLYMEEVSEQGRGSPIQTESTGQGAQQPVTHREFK